MIDSRTTRRFRRLFAALPAETQQEAKQAFRKFQADPDHPGLQFEKLQGQDVYSVRFGSAWAIVRLLRGAVASSSGIG